MFGGAPPAPSPAERAAARLQVRQTFRSFGLYVVTLWSTPLLLHYLNGLLGRHIA